MKKILMVEDDTDLKNMYTERLTDEGYKIFAVSSGEDALAAVRTEKPNYILLDIMLAGKLNGFDVLEVLKGDEELKSIPVLVFTNLDNQEEVAKNIGADEYLVKVNADLDDVVGRIKKRI